MFKSQASYKQWALDLDHALYYLDLGATQLMRMALCLFVIVVLTVLCASESGAVHQLGGGRGR